MQKHKIIGIFAGKTSTLSNNFETAAIKHPQDILHIRMNSIDHDEVHNQKYHGGDMRVIHQYSLKNYSYLKEKFPDIAHKFIPGSFGENICTEEMTESELNIGDIYSLGTAKIQLTVSRRPCATINYAYEDDRILKEVMKTGHTGWFYRVLQEGELRVGDFLELLERPFPELPVQKLYEQGYGSERFKDLPFLKRCLDTGLLDKGWKPKVEQALL